MMRITTAKQVRPKQPSENWVSSLWDYICKSGSGGGGGGGRGRAERDPAETVRLFERSWPLLPATGGVGSDKIRVLLELHPGMPVVSPLSEGLGSRKMSNSMVKVRANRNVWVFGGSDWGVRRGRWGASVCVDFRSRAKILMVPRNHCRQSTEYPTERRRHGQ